MNERTPEIRIVRIMYERLLNVRFGSSWLIATAAPVLVLFIENRVMKDKPMTIVLIAPKRKRNSLWSFMFRDCLPITAA